MKRLSSRNECIRTIEESALFDPKTAHYEILRYGITGVKCAERARRLLAAAKREAFK